MGARAAEPAQRRADRAWPGTLFAERGATALFYGTLALAATIHRGRAGLALEAFDGRVISEATLDGFDVAARVRLFALAGVAFLAAGSLVLVGLRLLERRVAVGHLRILSVSSIAGLALLYLRVFEFQPRESVALIVSLHALALLVGFLSRRLAAETCFPEPVAYVSWLAASAVALLVPLFPLGASRLPRPELCAAAFVLGAGLALHLALVVLGRCTASAPPRERIERCIHASLPLAALALVPFLRDESYLLLNGHGLFFLRPLPIQALLYTAICAWIAWRWRRARGSATRGARRFDLTAMLGRGSFPLLLVGALTLVGYRPRIDPPSDLLELANAGLSIQQWFDFGRLPFAETFDVHGLWDSAFGFVYALLSGTPGELFGFYDFGRLALPLALLYFFLRRATGNPYVALFTAAFLPYADELAPAYCAPALIAPFALDLALRRRSFGAWSALFAACALLAIWRVDIGFSAGAGVLGVLTLSGLFVPGPPLHFARAAAAAALVSAALLLAWCALCAAGGVDPLVRARDLLHVLLSNQAYGHTALAVDANDVFYFHLYAVPLAVLASALIVLRDARRERGRGRNASLGERAFLASALPFLACYFFANLPRGLVRHTFVEQGNVYLASFGALALGLAVWWRAGWTRPAAAFAGFAAITSVAVLHFPLDSPRAKQHLPRHSVWQELLAQLRVRTAVAPEERLLERDRVPADFAAKTFAELRAFLDANLSPEQTFLDLGHNPMLYVYVHRVSPHWLNHLMCAPDDYAQERVLEELERFDVPVVVLAQDPEEAKAAGARWLGVELDGVPFRLRHYRLFEDVYARYQPLALLDRWWVWVRADFALRAPPGERGAIRLDWRAGEATPPRAEGLRRTALAFVRRGETTRADFPPVDVGGDQALLLHFKGSASAATEVRVDFRLRSQEGATHQSRVIRLGAGLVDHAVLLAVPPALRAVDELTIDLGAGDAFALEALELEERRAPEYFRLARALRATEETELGLLPWIWGEHDAKKSSRRAAHVLFEAPPSAGGMTEDALPIEARSGKAWRNGIHLDLAGVMLDDGPHAVSLQRGDVLRFASGGEREVVGIVERQILVGGRKLDPEVDGAPAVVVWRRPALRGALVADGERRTFDLPPPRADVPHPYLVLCIANRSGLARAIAVEYGEGEAVAGRFVFEPRTDREEHEYCLRLSVHSSWWTRQGSWLALAPSGGAIELVAAALADGE